MSSQKVVEMMVIFCGFQTKVEESGSQFTFKEKLEPKIIYFYILFP